MSSLEILDLQFLPPLTPLLVLFFLAIVTISPFPSGRGAGYGWVTTDLLGSVHSSPHQHCPDPCGGSHGLKKSQNFERHGGQVQRDGGVYIHQPSDMTHVSPNHSKHHRDDDARSWILRGRSQAYYGRAYLAGMDVSTLLISADTSVFKLTLVRASMIRRLAYQTMVPL